MRSPLPKKEILHNEWTINSNPEYIIRWERVLFFDPSVLYTRINHLIDPHKRHLQISTDEMFPTTDGICACGCGTFLTGRSRRWATEQCSKFAWDVRNIICNAHQAPRFYIIKYFGDRCAHGCERRGEELDHIAGIAQGGSGGWLSNYQWVCKKCHRTKTNKTFGFKQT